MKRENLMRLFLGLLGVVMVGTSCKPQYTCGVNEGVFASPYNVRLTPVSVAGGCPVDKQAEWIDLWTFQKYTDTTPNLNKAGFIPLDFAFLGGGPNAVGLGDFSTLYTYEEGAQEYCDIPSMTPAELGGVSYTVTSFKVLSSPEARGAAFAAEVAYDDGLGCTGTYTANGVWPGYVECATDADCTGHGLVDEIVTYRCEDISGNPTLGANVQGFSGSPAPATGLCVLANEFPSLK